MVFVSLLVTIDSYTDVNKNASSEDDFSEADSVASNFQLCGNTVRTSEVKILAIFFCSRPFMI